MQLKKGDFIEIDYTGKLKTGQVFDTTVEAIAKEAGLFSKEAQYIPVIICVGEHHILKGIDEFLDGKEIGKFTVELQPEQAFGKKNAEYIKMIPASRFVGHKITPTPGLRVNIDGAVGIIRTISGGRCIVDFNHPLAGQVVEYDLNVHKVVTDKKQQVAGLLRVLLGIRSPEVTIEDKRAYVKVPGELPGVVLQEVGKKISTLTGLVLEFSPKEKKESPKNEQKSK